MRRKITALFLSLALLLGLFTALPTARAAGEAKQSGLTNLSKLTQGEITSLLNAAPDVDTTFAAQPVFSAPYSAGQLSDASLQAALNRVNLYRRIAGLKSVALDSGFTTAAQAAAMTMAVNGSISHYPAQPDGMSDELYSLASTGAIRSNLGHSSGSQSLIYTAIDLCMDDTDSSNFDRLGHRRWILDPTAEKVGFGYASNRGSFGAMYVVDSTRNRAISASDFDFIAWPSSGNFPSTLFGRDQAWSVSLNPELYTAPEKYTEDFSMTITFPDGTTQTIVRTYPLVYTDDSSESFLHISTTNTGSVSLCVIFRPDMTGYDEYPLGTYTIAFHGLKTKTGKNGDFSYEVTLFDPSASAETTSTETTPAETTQTESTVSFADVSPSSWYYDAVQYAVENGLFNGVGENSFAPDGSMTRAMVMTVLARMHGEDTTPRSGETWDIRGKRWAVGNRVSDGLNADQPITPEELAVMLYRAAGGKEVATDHLSDFGDGDAVSDWARTEVNWAIEVGLLRGDTDHRLNPTRVATRAQVAVMLQRYLNQPS